MTQHLLVRWELNFELLDHIHTSKRTDVRIQGIKVGYTMVLSRGKAALLSKDHVSKA